MRTVHGVLCEIRRVRWAMFPWLVDEAPLEIVGRAGMTQKCILPGIIFEYGRLGGCSFVADVCKRVCLVCSSPRTWCC